MENMCIFFQAPQVDVPILGRVLQACPQEPPEVYSNLLSPSVGETTGGIHPMPSGINISAHDIHYLQDIKHEYSRITIIGDKGYLSTSVQLDLFETSEIRL